MASAREARVGVLALQGASDPHLASFASIGQEAREVRGPEQLQGLSHLVLPGGESTTIHHLLELFELREPIVAAHRAGRLALFGVCAGAILLGRASRERPPRLELLDVEVERNSYGRQLASATRRVWLEALERDFDCTFIRAPRFRSVGPSVRVLAREGDDPILVEAPGILAATFHPELSPDAELHRYFLDHALRPRAVLRS